MPVVLCSQGAQLHIKGRLNRGSADYLERRDSADVKAGLEWCGPRDGEATWEPQRSLRKTEPWLPQVEQG